MEARSAPDRVGRLVGGLIVASVVVLAMMGAALVGVGVLVWRRLARQSKAIGSQIGPSSSRAATVR